MELVNCSSPSLSGRNLEGMRASHLAICYYSTWLQRPPLPLMMSQQQLTPRDYGHERVIKQARPVFSTRSNPLPSPMAKETTIQLGFTPLLGFEFGMSFGDQFPDSRVAFLAPGEGPAIISSV